MLFLSIFLLCVAPNLDNMAIGLAYGARKINVPFKSNLAIAIFSGLATLLSAALGNVISNIMPSFIGNAIGGSIVSIMGAYTIYQYFHDKNQVNHSHSINELGIENLKAIMEDPTIADKDFSGDISLKESILLGIALAVNCLGTGLGAGMVGINIFVLSLCVIVFSVITIWIGAFVGKRFASKFLGQNATLISGVLLFCVGIYEILL